MERENHFLRRTSQPSARLSHETGVQISDSRRLSDFNPHHIALFNSSSRHPSRMMPFLSSSQLAVQTFRQAGCGVITSPVDLPPLLPCSWIACPCPCRISLNRATSSSPIMQNHQPRLANEPSDNITKLSSLCLHERGDNTQYGHGRLRPTRLFPFPSLVFTTSMKIFYARLDASTVPGALETTLC